jgi:ankyrin repeat protein
MLNLGKRWKLIMVYICAITFVVNGFAVAGPLHEAAKEGDLVKIKSLIAEGFDINTVDNNEMTPLHLAAQIGYKEIAEILILKGANVNAKTKSGITPLRFNSQFKL